MPEPVAVRAMRHFKAQLLEAEAAQMQTMAARWIEVERRLEAQISLLSREIYDMRQMGVAVNQGKLYRLDRYQRLLRQIDEEFIRYANYADAEIVRQQANMGRLGVSHATEVIDLSYKEVGQIGVSFYRLPVAATEFMVGLASDGSPLRQLLIQRMTKESGAIDRLTSTLINGVAQGINPRRVASQMKDDLAGGLQKALVIARTEQLRVYREASRMQYEASGVVTGHKRICAHDSRVCAACLADEGHVYPITQAIPDHPNGRCSSISVIEDMPEPKFDAGETWFTKQSEKRQRSILGDAHYEAWKSGKFQFGDMLHMKQNKTWGPSPSVKSLKELVGEAKENAA